MYPKDYEKLMEIALAHAELSRHPHTKCGALLLNKAGYIVSTGYNTIPPQLEDLEERWTDEERTIYVEHAERVAIYKVAQDLVSVKEGILVCTLPPCIDCARAIICSGIATVVHLPLEGSHAYGKWADSCHIGHDMMVEAGIRIRQLERETV